MTLVALVTGAACSDVWVAPLREIASYVRNLGLPPRAIVRPDPSDF